MEDMVTDMKAPLVRRVNVFHLFCFVTNGQSFATTTKKETTRQVMISIQATKHDIMSGFFCCFFFFKDLYSRM